MSADIAVAHKDYDVRGGGEIVAEELARVFDAPLIVGRRDDACEPDNHSLDIREIDLERWQRWAIDRGPGALRSLAYQIAWQAVPQLTDYDTIITSGNEPLWYVPEDDQTVVAYTHSPPRFQYDLFQRTYADNARLGGIPSALYATAVRTLYQHNVTRPDLYVANSDRVARRIRQYWNIPEDQIRVVYPPVRTHEYSPSDAETQDYYLYLGRLAGHKRVESVVDAFGNLDDELIVAGTGPEEDALCEQAPENVTFRGYVDDDRKRELYASAKALVYPPDNEDFGMVPVEAMAAGTPVIGVREGFTEYQIKDGENGLTYDREGLTDAIHEFNRNGVAWSPEEIASFATEHFSVDAFRSGMIGAVLDAREDARVNVPWKNSDGTDSGATKAVARPDGGGDSS